MLVYGFSLFSNVPPGIFYFGKLSSYTILKVSVSFTLADCSISGANLDDELGTPLDSGIWEYFLSIPLDDALGLRINGDNNVLLPKGINIY